MTSCHNCQGEICHYVLEVMYLRNNLKELRKRKGLTQLAVQMQTGIEQSLLSKYENGERVPPTEALMRLADFYGTSMDYIMARTDDPKLNKK